MEDPGESTIHKQVFQFELGEVLLVDKPQGWTSFDVVNKIRGAIRKKLGIKNIKVGHAGTLDPMATGLLIICTGKFTKRLDTFQSQDKQYTGSLILGATTPSYDKETEIDHHFPTEHITPEMLASARTIFVGNIQQLPPMYSAIKMEGQPLYKKARKGETIALQPRSVRIDAFDFTHIQFPQIDFKVECSKGTYIRSLAFDFGKALASGAYLTALCRTRIGSFHLADAWNLEALLKKINS